MRDAADESSASAHRGRVTPSAPLLHGTAVRRPADDRFGRWPFAQAIARIVRDPYSRGLLVVGIEGPWGSGKSSTLQLVADELTRDGRNREVMVSAWRTSGQEQFLANLSYALATSVRRDWRGAFWRIAWAKLRRQSLPTQIAVFTPILYLLALLMLPEVRGFSRVISDNPKKWIEGLGIFGLPFLGYVFSKLSQPAVDSLRTMFGGTKAESIGAMERFAYDFDVLAAAQPARTRFVVIVEDLDRCPPSHVLDVLSAIGQLEAHPQADRIAFLLAYERTKLLKSVGEAVAKDAAATAQSEAAQDYVEKIVHLELPLPDLLPVTAATNPGRSPRLTTVARGFLVSVMFVAAAVARLAGSWANLIAAWTIVLILVGFAIEFVVGWLMTVPRHSFDPGDWQAAEAAVGPWLQALPLRQRARVLSRARVALLMQDGSGLTAWEAVSTATLASRWPDRFSREKLKEMIGVRAIDPATHFQLQDLADAIAAMDAAPLGGAHFRDPAKLHAVVSTFKR